MNVDQNIIQEIRKVYRVELKRGFRFQDQSGNLLRKCATTPYTHAAVNQWPASDLFLSFHSTPNPRPTHRTLVILRVIPIEPLPPREEVAK